jgi:hypothetical protein
MNAVTDFDEGQGDDRGATLRISETYWGYIVRERAPEQDRHLLRNSILIFLGAVLMVVGLGQWILPGSLLTTDVLPIKMALTAVLMSMGLGCFHSVQGPRHVEVQVDTSLRELRVVERDRRNTSHLIQRVLMRDIDSAYVKRGVTQVAGGHLLLTLANSDDPLHLASGSERELRLLHDRLRHDLRPARERVERRLLRQASEAMPETSPMQQRASA